MKSCVQVCTHHSSFSVSNTHVVEVKGEGEGMAVKCCNFESLLSCIIFTVIVTFVEVTVRFMGSFGIVDPTG